MKKKNILTACIITLITMTLMVTSCTTSDKTPNRYGGKDGSSVPLWVVDDISTSSAIAQSGSALFPTEEESIIQADADATRRLRLKIRLELEEMLEFCNLEYGSQLDDKSIGLLRDVIPDFAEMLAEKSEQRKVWIAEDNYAFVLKILSYDTIENHMMSISQIIDSRAAPPTPNRISLHDAMEDIIIRRRTRRIEAVTGKHEQ